MSGYDDILDIETMLDRSSLEKERMVRQLIIESGRTDVLDDYDRQLRDVKTGVYGAKMAWHSISSAQRKVLLALNDHAYLRKASGSQTRYDAAGGPANVCGIATVRNLIRRGLVACDGTAFDPEAIVVLTERGRFVLRHRSND